MEKLRSCIAAYRLQVAKLRHFIAIYRLYAQHNPRRYALRIAYGMAYDGLPF